MKRCHNCGAPVPSTYCPQCGAPVPTTSSKPSPLQMGLSIGSVVLSFLSVAAAGFLYWTYKRIWANLLPTDPYPEHAAQYYDLGWVILWAGGGVALALAIWALVIKGKGRLWGGVAAGLAAIAITLGFVMAA